jgi:hypothetical protein
MLVEHGQKPRLSARAQPCDPVRDGAEVALPRDIAQVRVATVSNPAAATRAAIEDAVPTSIPSSPQNAAAASEGVSVKWHGSEKAMAPPGASAVRHALSARSIPMK